MLLLALGGLYKVTILFDVGGDTASRQGRSYHCFPYCVRGAIFYGFHRQHWLTSFPRCILFIFPISTDWLTVKTAKASAPVYSCPGGFLQQAPVNGPPNCIKYVGY
jgi:hypothetical protein